MHKQVLNYIELLIATFGRYEDYSGGCIKFHLILKEKFNGVGFYNQGHCITLINGRYYDIDGEYKGDLSDFIPLKKHFTIDFIINSYDGTLNKSLIKKFW